MKLDEFFTDKGYSVKEKNNFKGYIETWKSWYKGKVKGFHSYYIYNRPGKKVKRERRSMQMPKKICEDWADLLYNEKVKVTLSNKTDDELLQKIIKDLKLDIVINRGIEKSFALGTGALVLSVQNLKTNGETLDTQKAKLFVEFVDAQKIYPLSWNNEEITECAFVTRKLEKGQAYVYICMHLLDDNGNYKIDNYKFKETNGELVESADERILETFNTESDKPWFAVLKPNICNNIDFESPFGISIFANSISTLMNLDDIYDSKDLEVVLGRRRTFVSEDLLTVDTENGEQVQVFDANDISVYVLPKGFNKDQMIISDNDGLRTDTMINDLNSELNVLSSKVGFGNERYKFDKGDIQTATGVISANSDMFRTMKKHENALESVLIELIEAIIYASTKYTSQTFSKLDDEIKIDFDDSIIEDKGQEQLRAQSEVSAGLRSKQDYMENIRNMTKDQIAKELQLITEEKQSNMEAFGFNNVNEETE